MSDEQDRGASVSDLRRLESTLVEHIERRLSEDGEKTRRQFGAEIRSEGEKTRQHFDVVAERVESLVKLVAEVNSHHAIVLDDHEHRLKGIETQR